MVPSVDRDLVWEHVPGIEIPMKYGEDHDEDEDEQTLPVLRRLHIASPISFDLFLHRLHPLAPHLTHVRLSELLAFDYNMARAIHSELAGRGSVPGQFPRPHESQWSNAEPCAVQVDWERFLPPPAQLRLSSSSLRSSRELPSSCVGVARGITAWMT